MFAVAELDGHLDLKFKYVYVNGMLVGKIDANDELFQYFHDGLGSITMIVDSTGSYQNLYTYDDFGDFRKKDENVSNSYCYTGQERDENPSGLYNLRARYYAAGMGRFTQEDPVLNVSSGSSGGCCGSGGSGSSLGFSAGFPQKANAYVYVGNNPTIYIDPMGLSCTKAEARIELQEIQRAYEECRNEINWGWGPYEGFKWLWLGGWFFGYGHDCGEYASEYMGCIFKKMGANMGGCCHLEFRQHGGRIHATIDVKCDCGVEDNFDPWLAPLKL